MNTRKLNSVDRARNEVVFEPLETRLLLAASPFETPIFTSLPYEPQLRLTPLGSYIYANGDNIADFVAVHDDGNNPPALSTLSVLTGQSNGTVTESWNTTFPGKINDVEIDDHNHDGRLDMVVLYHTYSGATPTAAFVRVFLSNGNGTFTQSQSFSAPVNSTLTVLNMNADAHPDVVLMESGMTAVNVCLGSGTGTFAAAQRTDFGAGKTINHFNDDLNGDNIVDIILNYSVGTPIPTGENIEVHLGQSTGLFNTTSQWTDSGHFSHVSGLHQLSGDTRLDMIVYRPSSFMMTGSTDLLVFRNNGDGTFTQTWSKTLANGFSYFIMPADLDKDSDLDLVFADGQLGTPGAKTVYVEHNNGSAVFTDAQDFQVSNLSMLMTSSQYDVDHDTWPDLAVHVMAGGSPPTDWGVGFFFNNHTGRFISMMGPTMVKSSDPPTGFGTVSDLNNDNLWDVVFLRQERDANEAITEDNAYVFMNSTGRTFAPEVKTEFGAATLLDTPPIMFFDANTNSDALPFYNVTYDSTEHRDIAQGFTFWGGDGDGSFTQATPIAQTSGQVDTIMHTLDYEQDSDLDIVLIGVNPTGLYVVKNKSGGAPPAQQPDLVVQTLTAPNGQAGSQITVSATVKNQGAAATGSGYTVAYYLSDNSTWEAGDQLLTTTNRAALAVNATDTFNVQLTLPIGASGNKFIIAYADWNGAAGAIDESNETNNTKSDGTTVGAAPLPDLIVQTLTAPNGQAGSQVTVSTTVKNQGAAATGSGYTVAYYLSDNNTWGPGDQLLTTTNRAALAVNATDTFNVQLTLPIGASGSKFIIAYADWNGAAGAIDESNETNNTKSDGTTVGAAPLPDLIVQTLTAPDGLAGSAVNVDTTIKNQGAAATGSGYTVAYYLSDNSTWETGDQLLTTTNRAVLAVGATDQFVLPVTLPAGAGGTKYVIAYADWDGTTGSIAETSETNNTRADQAGIGVATYELAMGGTQPTTVKYTEPDGTPVTLAMATGTLTARFAGVIVPPVITAGTKSVTLGGQSQITEIVLDTTTNKSTVTFTTTGSGAAAIATVDAITGPGELSSLAAAKVDLVGAGLNIAGCIKTVTLHDLQNGADLVMNGPGPTNGVTLTLNRLFHGSDVSLPLAGIAKLKALDWAGSGLTALWATTINIAGDKTTAVAGDFGADLNLTAATAPGNKPTLGSITVAGAASGGWVVALGGAGTVKPGSTAAAWDAVFGGAIKTFQTTTDLSGNLTAYSIATLTVNRDLIDAAIQLNQPIDPKVNALGTATVKRWTQNSKVRCVGNANSFTTGGVEDSVLFAGVAGSNLLLPDEAADFDGQATIKTFTVNGITGAAYSTINSSVAAWSLGTMKLKSVDTGNAGVDFGLAFHTLSSLQYNVGTTNYRWPATGVVKPPDNGDLTFNKV